MKRRTFLVLVGAAGAWPLGAPAQKPIPVIGFLSSRAAAESAHLVAGFREGLREGGYIEGETVAIEYRWANNQYDRLPVLAAELVGRSVAVIVAAGGPPSALAAKTATAVIPIVFTSVGNPVEIGLVASLGRPGGNVTGSDSTLSAELDAKRLELLHELLPATGSVGVLLYANRVNSTATAELETAARTLKLRLVMLSAHDAESLDGSFAALLEQGLGALLVSADPFFDSRREQVVNLAARHAVPAIYQWREFAAAGGLMSYGASLPGAYHQAGLYAGRILKGAKPAELPVQRPTKFELVINLKTAKALGITVPPTLLARADEVIE